MISGGKFLNFLKSFDLIKFQKVVIEKQTIPITKKKKTHHVTRYAKRFGVNYIERKKYPNQNDANIIPANSSK